MTLNSNYYSESSSETILSRPYFSEIKTTEDLISKYIRTNETSIKSITPIRDSILFSSQSSFPDSTKFDIKKSKLRPKVSIESGSTVENIGKIFMRFDAFLLIKAHDYVAGKIDIPELVQEFGGAWTESSVVLLLEKIGAYRHMSVSALSDDEEYKVLRKLANIRSSKIYETYNEEHWIKREVIASQRIESIHLFPEDISE